MKLKHTIAPDLVGRWLPIVERQFDLTLAPLEVSLQEVSVALAVAGENGSAGYRFEVTGTTTTGGKLAITIEHRDGRVAITDAFARARREVARSRQQAFTPPRRRGVNEPAP